MQTARNDWTPERIRRLRARLGLTQLEFATMLRVVPGTVQRWEYGRGAKPLGPATVILDLLERQVALAELLATSGPRPKRGRPRKSQ